MYWLISSQLKPRYRFYETVLWQAEVTLNKTKSSLSSQEKKKKLLKSSLSRVSEQNLVKTLSRGLRWFRQGIWRNFLVFLFMHHCCRLAHTQNCVSIMFINVQPQTQLRKETHVSRANVIKRDVWTLLNARQTCSSEESWSFVLGLPKVDESGITPWRNIWLSRRIESLLIWG